MQHSSLLRLFLLVTLATAQAFSPTPPSSRTTQLAALTPNQIKLLRKEAAQRLARKSLAQVFLPNEMDDATTLETISQKLQQHELVQVRGISRDNIRHVYAETQQIVMELNLMDATRTVDMVETSGHSSILYAPADPPRITLRSSYKEGQWTKKPKKPRDIRGQIILGDVE